jgi:hypothetical protein
MTGLGEDRILAPPITLVVAETELGLGEERTRVCEN